MRLVIAVAAASFLITGCREAADEPASNAGANDTAAAPQANAAAPNAAGATPLGDPVAGEEAQALMKTRHDGMEEIGDAMKVLSREVKSDSPDLAAVRTQAATIARLAPEVSGWFRPGSGPDVAETDALAAIWQDPADFAAKRTAFQQAAERFNTAAQGTDVAAIRTAHADLGKSCKACHDLYREKE